MKATDLKKRIDLLLYFFIFGLVVSGLTAIPLQWELELLNRFLGQGSWGGKFLAIAGPMDHLCWARTQRRVLSLSVSSVWN